MKRTIRYKNKFRKCMKITMKMLLQSTGLISTIHSGIRSLPFTIEEVATYSDMMAG
jgi:hypothetical protein